VVGHLLCVLGEDLHSLPARVCGLLAQRNIPVSSIQMSKPVGSQHWWIQLVVCVESTSEVERVVNRLSRLVDVIDVSSEPSHQRQSMFVKLRPTASDLIHVREVARLFAAEVLEVTPAVTTLYLSATPRRCEQFLALLAPYSIVEALPSAVSGIRAESTDAHPWIRNVAQPARSDRLAPVCLYA
jgi:acetolactate synthase I/III small subunit